MFIKSWIRCFIHFSFIHSGYFYSASSSPLLLRGAPDIARVPCRNFTPKRHRQLWVCFNQRWCYSGLPALSGVRCSECTTCIATVQRALEALGNWIPS